MSSWLTAAGLAFAASLHCVGMCGGFVLALAARGGWRALGSHLQFQLGKATTYAFLGTIAGALGQRLVASAGLVWGARLLAAATGVALVLAALSLLGLRATQPVTGWIAALWGRTLRPLLGEARPPAGSLAAGMIVGALPCPMVYAGLAAAAATAEPLAGAFTLAGLALGTVPALALVALTGAAVPWALRRRLTQATAIVLLIAGALTLARAGGLLVVSSGTHASCCHGGSM